MTVSRNRAFAKLASDLNNAGQITVVPDDVSSGGITLYSTLDDLPFSGNTGGDQAFITDTNRLNIWDDTKSAWFNVTLLNLAPSINSIQDSDGLTAPFLLSQNGDASVITVNATDGDGDPLTYSAVVDSDFNGLATISQNANVFTVTPLSEDSATTTSGTVTFSTTDNINTDTAVSTFNLYFWIYDLVGANVAYSQYSTATDVAADMQQHYFRSDGSKVYAINSNGAEVVYQFSLSTPWDVSTITYDNKSIDIRDTGNEARCIFFKSDGTVLYGGGPSLIASYNLSTPWDVSSGARPYDSVVAHGAGSFLNAIFFKPDGTRLYASCRDGNLYQWPMSTAWDITTIGSPTTFGIPRPTTGQGLFFSPDGTKFWVTNQETSGTNIYQYTMSTAWNISTASSDNITFNLYNMLQSAGAGAESIHRSLWFGGNKFFTFGGGIDRLYEFDIS